MKKILITTLMLLGLISSASAEVTAKGFYIGAGYGNTSFDDSDGLGLKRLDNDADSGYKIYTGFQFNRVVGIEGTLTNYGTFTYLTKEKVEPETISIAANLGYNFLGDQLRPYAIVGLSYINMNQTGAVYKGEDKTAGFHYGLGFEYSPSLFQGVGFRLEYSADIFAVTTEEIKNNQLESTTSTQSLGMLNLAVHYKF